MTGLLRRVRRRLLHLPRDVGYVWAPKLMSRLRRRWVLLRHPHATIELGRGTYLGPGFSLHIPADGTFVTGPGCEFRRGFRCEVGPGGTVSIGAGTRFTYDVLVQCSSSIEIGERCMFGQSSAIFDGNHRFRDPNLPLLAQGYDLRPIRLSDDAIVTTKCTIMADVGEHAFIGANSVVSRDVPPFTLAVGAPARPVDYFGPEGSEPPDLERSPAASG